MNYRLPRREHENLSSLLERPTGGSIALTVLKIALLLAVYVAVYATAVLLGIVGGYSLPALIVNPFYVLMVGLVLMLVVRFLYIKSKVCEDLAKSIVDNYPGLGCKIDCDRAFITALRQYKPALTSMIVETFISILSFYVLYASGFWRAFSDFDPTPDINDVIGTAMPAQIDGVKVLSNFLDNRALALVLPLVAWTIGFIDDIGYTGRIACFIRSYIIALVTDCIRHHRRGCRSICSECSLAAVNETSKVVRAGYCEKRMLCRLVQLRCCGGVNIAGCSDTILAHLQQLCPDRGLFARLRERLLLLADITSPFTKSLIVIILATWVIPLLLALTMQG